MANDVTSETLQELLARGAETDDLDYKSSWDPSNKEEVLELAKDVAAMESLPEGGYLIIGADDRGRPSGTFHPQNEGDFDEQRVRGKFVSLLGEPIAIRVALHDLQGNWYLLLAVSSHPAGVRVMGSDRGTADKRAWRAGDVLVRRGTSSVRWNQHEAAALIEAVIARRREEWRREVAMTAALSAPPRSAGGQIEIAAESPLEVVGNTVTQLLRAPDRVGLDLFRRSVVGRARDVAARLAASERADSSDAEALAIELSGHLDRLNTLAVLIARYDDEDRLRPIFQSYQEIQGQLDEPNYEWTVAPRGQMVILLQAFVLGGALVHEGFRASIAAFARIPPRFDGNGYWSSMIDKASVLASRGGQLQDDDGRGSISPITRSEPMLVALLDRTSEFVTEDDARNVLIRFDVFRSISTYGAGKSAYPFFARFFTKRAESAFAEVVVDPSSKEALFEGGDDALAGAFRAISDFAGKQETNFDGWRGFSDPNIVDFLTSHPVAG
jgi:hypothetical protein